MSSPVWDEYARSHVFSRNRLLYPRHPECLDDFLRFFRTREVSERVLDIGAGRGFFLVLLRELGFTDLTGVDASATNVQYMQQKNFQALEGNVVTGAGFDKLRPPYDVILLMEVLEHLADPRQALANLAPLLSPQGRLYLTVPICDCIFDRVRRRWNGMSRLEQLKAMDETHLHAFCHETIENLLKEAGFRVEQQRRVSFEWLAGLDYVPGRRLHLLLRALLPQQFKGLDLVTEASLR